MLDWPLWPRLRTSRANGQAWKATAREVVSAITPATGAIADPYSAGALFHSSQWRPCHIKITHPLIRCPCWQFPNFRNLGIEVPVHTTSQGHRDFLFVAPVASPAKRSSSSIKWKRAPRGALNATQLLGHKGPTGAFYSDVIGDQRGRLPRGLRRLRRRSSASNRVFCRNVTIRVGLRSTASSNAAFATR